MATSRQVFQVKITLRGTRPPIWRRLLVRDTVSLRELHYSLQLAMGWTNSHLHQFIKGRAYYGMPDPQIPETRNESKIKLNDVLRKPKDRILYEYDFGDGWLHDIVLERVADAEPRGKYPWILAGKRACPPEDCGGVSGYYGLLQALSDPDDPEYEEMLEWLGGGFDPEAFDVQEKNRMLHGGWYRSRQRG